ncbi:hypothetical protein VOLCADRAFT_119771, partial [Volvox carteri f. nagariensis]
MYIFAGSYERFVFGFSASADCSEPQEIVKRYTFAAHKSAVKCLEAAGPYVASGGADDLIHLYDMKAERDLGLLMNPCDGAVPCLQFYTPQGRTAPSHLLSGSADGAINIWRCRGWDHLKGPDHPHVESGQGPVHVHRPLGGRGGDGSVRLWDVRTSGVVGGWERAHASRVRGMALLRRGDGSDKLPASLATASSDGTIKLWDIRKLCRGTGHRAGEGQLEEADKAQLPPAQAADQAVKQPACGNIGNIPRPKLDPKDFQFVQCKGEAKIKMPGSINGQSFMIDKCENCDIYILDHCAQVTIDECTDCRIYIGPTDGSVFLRDSSNCNVATVCRQLRTRDCMSCNIALYCRTKPIVESSSDVRRDGR